MKQRQWFFPLILFVAGMVSCFSVEAGVISDRATLDTFLGGDKITEDFEAYDLYGAAAVGLMYPGGAPVYSLNNDTILGPWNSGQPNQGPGLVVKDVTFSGGQLEWAGPAHSGQLSKNIGSSNTLLEVNFHQVADAFGLDLSVLTGYPDVAKIEIFGVDDTTFLGSFNVPVSAPDPMMFWGYSDSNGIGRFMISSTQNYWGPKIDNLSFNQHPIKVVPEPVSMLLFSVGGLALAALRKKKSRA